MNTTKKQCLNCNHIVTDTYCGKCGQSILTSRINLKHLMEELQSGILHVNKGILFTAKELVFRPGTTIKNYLAGKRIEYSKPFTFILIWGGIYSLIFHLFHYFPIQEMNRSTNTILEYIPLYDWYNTHYSLQMLFTLPFFASGTFLLFRKNNEYNYIEHLVAFSFINGEKIVLLLLFYPLIYFSRSIPVYHLAHTVTTLYTLWGITQFLRTSSWIKTILKVLVSFILTFLFLTLFTTVLFELCKYYNIRLDYPFSQ